nr:hypothetical protein [Rhizobium sp. ICMP 5592]
MNVDQFFCSFFGRADCRRVEAGRAWLAGRRSDPSGWNIGTDILSLEEAIRGLQSDQVRELKQVLEKNTRLKRLVVELSLDKAVLQDVPSKKFPGQRS